MGDFAIAIDTLHENEVEEIIIDVTQIIKESAQWHPECCIYKVPKRLRKVMEQAYTPKLISIGPVHYDNGELPNMKTLKLKYFKDFFSRTFKSQKEFASIIEANEDKIRHCYAEEIPLPERKDFVKMILLDSIFIIELFWRNFERARRSTQKEYMVKDYILRDYILNKPWLACGILQDLRLLENQLPYFILEQLHKKSGFPRIYNSWVIVEMMQMLEIKSSITEVVQILHFIFSHYLYLNGILVSLPYVGPFEHTCCLESLLSVALYLDYRGEDESILDTTGCVGDAPADGEGRNSKSWHGLVSDDKVGGAIKAMPAFYCSAKIFCKYLAFSPMPAEGPFGPLCEGYRNSSQIG